MGATLPILVSYLQRYFLNLGKTVGLLYAVNTFGSALAAFFTVEILFVFTGLQNSIYIAAFCNVLTAGLIFQASHRLKNTTEKEPEHGTTSKNLSFQLPFSFAFILLAAIGYLSLSQEILWYRLLGFLTGSPPEIFGLLLTAFLIGIAAGSMRAKKLCEQCEQGEPVYRHLLSALFIACLIFYLSAPAIAACTAWSGKNAGLTLSYILIGVVAFYLGSILPILIHITTPPKNAPAHSSMSLLYFANILGASLGPLFTGFILLDHFSLEENIILLSLLSFGCLMLIVWTRPSERQFARQFSLVVCVVTLTLVPLHEPLYRHLLERLQYASSDAASFKYVLENKAGIITVEAGKTSSDSIYGGGIYDGKFNIDPLINDNLIERAYLVSALHRQAKHVLEIGLSSGSWTRVLLNYRDLEQLTVVEINPGYPEIASHYPHIASIFTVPRMNLIFDDGRRWLRNHPTEKFDFIVMNTTFYWRSNATNLLSQDFLRLAKQHLNERGVIYYNTTGNDDVIYTAAKNFKYITRIRNFVAASDAPFNLSVEERRHNLLQFQDESGHALFNQSTAYQQELARLSEYDLKDVRDEILRDPRLQLITDDNMAAEYKYGKRKK
jgi:predicted membrane-bound spermidine synthase